LEKINSQEAEANFPLPAFFVDRILYMEIQPAGLRDLNALRKLEKNCFEKDAWPLLDLIAVLTQSNVIRPDSSPAIRVLRNLYPGSPPLQLIHAGSDAA